MELEREVGIGALMAAARLCEAVRAELVVGDALAKEDRSPVTVADFGAQAVVCKLLGDALPGDAIVAEEDSAALRDSANAAHLAAVIRFVGAELANADEDRVCAWIDRGGGEPGDRHWVLDPIDGTKGFLRQDQYAIALALIENGAIEWGFLACPAFPHDSGTGLVCVARRDGGAEALALDGSSLGPLVVSTNDHAVHARLVESVESGHTNRSLSYQLREALGVAAEPIRMDSQAKYAAVARGQAEIYLRSPNPRTPDYREQVWDHAAGWLVVTEAGGMVTDVHGQSLDWTRGGRLERNIGVVATNGHVHQAVIDALRPLLAARPASS